MNEIDVKPEQTTENEAPPPPLPVAEAEAAPMDEKPSWTETDDRALMLFIQDAKKSKTDDSDLLDDTDEEVCVDIAERFPGKSATNCIMRYARMKIREMESQIMNNSAVAGVSNNTTLPPGDGQKRSAEDDGNSADGKKNKVSEESLALWTDEETNMLREIVSQYPNSEYENNASFVSVQNEQWFSTVTMDY